MFRLIRAPGLRPVIHRLSLSPGLISLNLFVNNTRCYSKKVDPKSLAKWRQWGLYFNSPEFKKSMVIYYVCAFGATSVALYYYMRDRYHEDKLLDYVREKHTKDADSLSEYEYLVFKKYSHLKLRPLEEKKYRIYQMMRKEFRRKNLLSEEIFSPSIEELDEWYGKQVRRGVGKAPSLDKEEMAQEPELEILVDNPAIMPPMDTTKFYDDKAIDYDSEVQWEERAMFMGGRRKWLMKQLHGDVLEVACGTGRNIPYFYPQNVHSITFLDCSRNMLDITHEKFRKAFPDYRNVAFTVGKAEELKDLAGTIKYDTIVEAFGLCSHEDPVKALKNMKDLLKPNGRIVLLEHGRSTWGFINNHLDFRSEKRMKTWACRWNLEIGELIDQAGLDITVEKRVHFGSTWMLVCKRPEDSIKVDEKLFLQKLFGLEPKV